MDKINIEIDGKTLEAAQGSMLIEVADQNNIHIPRFCYHKKLSVAANCRMCLVEVEKAPKPLPACATPVTPGMIVRTRSKKALEAQRAVMEFLLINHPLDCPICDQGGECELQDLAMGYGKDISRYTEGKRSVKDKNIGPLIATDMTRCIQCTRCVRFGEEIAGEHEMGGVNRGEHLEIGTYLDHSMRSELSGNIIDLCPVGALTSKPFRFKARAWELQQRESIAIHDCLGSNIYIHVRRNQVMRVVPHENEAINEPWLSDRDRFSYTGLESADRLSQPLLKRNGQWEKIDWQTAFEQAAVGLKHVVEKHSAQQLAGLISPNASIEELYLFQKLLRSLNSNNVDHRLRQTDFSHQDCMPLFPGLYCSIADIETADRILLVGSNIHHEVPLLGQRIRKAQLRDAKISTINPLAFSYHFMVEHNSVSSPAQMVHTLAGVAAGLGIQVDVNVTPNATATAIAKDLIAGQQVLILLGAITEHHPQATTLRHLAKLIADHCKGKVGLITEGANAAGAWLAGAIPHRLAAGVKAAKAGLNAAQITAGLKGYLLFGIEPALDSANPRQFMQSLRDADFVVAFATFQSSDLLEVADVILPVAPWTETSGTVVNVAGQWQSFKGLVPPFSEVRPGWKVLRVMGNVLELDGFEYTSSEQIRDEMQASVNAFVDQNTAVLPSNITLTEVKGLTRVTTWPIYRGDAIVRRAQPLQETVLNPAPAIYINKKLAEQLGVQAGTVSTVRQGQGQVTLPVVIDQVVPDECIYIPAGFMETAQLDSSSGPIEWVRS